MPSTLPPAIFLMGPTAAGKTDLALRLTEELPCEIISVDSALIYKGMDIGTAKPDRETLERYPHRLVDILDPSQSYSAADFRRDALAAMTEITAAGKIPLLVGGTMMYYNALVKGLANLPEADPVIRQRLSDWGAAEGWPAVHARLAEVDPESAKRLKPNDSQRIQRALEIYEITGRTMTSLWAEQTTNSLPYQVANLAVMPGDRSVLHQRIEQRFELMLEAGFLDEVQALYDRGDLDINMPSIRCVGYRQAWSYLTGDYDYDTLIFKGVVATRQLAKRQITWLRSWDDLHWLDSKSGDVVNDSLKLINAAII
ncbi:tRNA (adenosine(37)-N6)-dimethylallyltransferase MiaA [Neptunomonas phycophila]|jgi:tRNA dimethylallyltransferase|uniref:tRNA (adenosine(37)-N6)-dimethylallyltransferase MiaA n=1 Tax=Neptunomonas phycophila TaxID=1572645 RepID=UPI0015BCAA67|nr:tRNA (adenosine(37)-N6)-dimethylallyltransferase MiaA [Neptunomonas phycophila]QLE98573.1 tRNA (adenosine(37)-N6)-dimethylallyltransferase MiaA [Neptunomonas phycophila]